MKPYYRKEEAGKIDSNAKKSILAIGLTLFIVVTAQGQSLPTGGSHVVLPSPNSWSAANETSVDVDMYTGRLNYSVPIHVLKSRDLELPVSLQYSSDGVKVDDLASDVGLGWQLNAGGVIARVMRGLPDEFDGPYDVAHPCQPPGSICHDNIQAKGFLDPNVGDYADENYWTSNMRTEDERKQIVEFSNRTGNFVELGQNAKVWDTEPDEFYFNFDRYSGKFVFDKNGDIQIIPHQNLLITKTTGTNLYSNAEAGATMIISFQVTDDRGIKYTFGNINPVNSAGMTAIDVTKYSLGTAIFQLGFLKVGSNLDQDFYKSTPVLLSNKDVPGYIFDDTPNKQTFTSSWHLTKIESPTGDFINLDYINEEIKYLTGRTHDLSQLNMEKYLVQNEGICFATYKSGDAPTFVYPSNDEYHEQDFIVSTSKSTIKSKKLNSIVAATGERINLVSSVTRNDLLGAKRIERIIITNSDNGMIKSYDLLYETRVSFLEEYIYEFKSKAAVDGNGEYLYPYQFMTGTQLEKYTFDPVPLGEGDWAAMIGADHYRLFLTGIAEYFPGTGLETLVAFEYDIDDLRRLPPRFSSKQDSYGYYNNNQAGHTLQSIQYKDSDQDGTSFPVVFASMYRDNNGNLVPSPRSTTVIVNGDSSKAKIGNLKTITHKNGSKIVIDYTKNLGLRVSKISNYPDKNVSSSFEKTIYSYISGQRAGFDPKYLTDNLFKILPDSDLRLKITLSSVPVNQSMTKTKGGFVGYTKVEKIRTGNGKEVFEFRSPESVWDVKYERYESSQSLYPLGSGAQVLNSGDYYPYAPFSSAEHKRGQLYKRTIYNEAGKKLQEDTYNYLSNPSGYIPQTIYGLKPGKEPLGNGVYAASFYKYTTDWVYLDNVESKVYDQLDESKVATTTMRYHYYRPGESAPVPDMLPRKVYTTLPNGDIMNSETKYPLDYTTTATPSDIAAKGIHLLKSKKMESVPIEGITYLERTVASATTRYLLGASLIKFKEFQTGKVYPWEAYKLKAGLGNIYTNYAWSTINSNVFTWINATNFKFSGSIDSYDTFGKPLSQTGEDGIQSVLAWGYSNSLLTSLIRNAGTYQHQTSYLYQPIIGVIQTTDPNSRNQKYAYDRYGRLKLESDHDDQILVRYRYHYQNQVEGFTNTVIGKSGCYLAGQSINFLSPENLEFGQTSYNWNFGNGTSQSTTSTSINYAYPSAGTFTVSLSKGNPDYPSQSIQTQVVIYRQIGSVNSSVTGPTSYDVCNIAPPSQSTTLFTSFRMTGKLPTDAFNVVWEYQFNGGSWVQMSYTAGPISSTSIGAPTGFGDATITGTWTVRCTGQDACGNPNSASFNLSNYASNPLCSNH